MGACMHMFTLIHAHIHTHSHMHNSHILIQAHVHAHSDMRTFTNAILIDTFNLSFKKIDCFCTILILKMWARL